MGGGRKPDLGEIARDHQLSVFSMDDLTRRAQEAYIQQDPQHRNPSSKNFLFSLEFSKYRSNILDMMKEKKDYLDKVRPLIESVVDKAGKFDVSTRAQLTQEVGSQLTEIGEEFIVVQKTFTDKKYENLNRRLRYTTKRCYIMAERVLCQIKLMETPEKNPAWKRVRNPELDMETSTILQLIYTSHVARDEVDRVFSEGDKLHGDFLKEYSKHMLRIVEFTQLNSD